MGILINSTRQQYNIILITVDYGSRVPRYISIIFKNKEKYFQGQNSLKDFMEFLKEKSQKKKKITFFTDNATFLFLTFLNFEPILQQIKPIEFLAIKNKIYFFNLYFDKSKFHFRDINLFFPNWLSLKYDSQTTPFKPLFFTNFYVNGDSLPLKPLNFSLTKSEQQTYKMLRPFWVSDVTTPKKKPVKESQNKKEILKTLKVNLFAIFKALSVLESTFKELLPFWIDSYVTTSSIAKSAFKIKFNKFNISLTLLKEEDDKIRPGYVGGRCEVFGNPLSEKENIYYFDFKSMYGQIMLENFPTGELIFSNSVSSLSTPGFYYVKVRSDNFQIPILPFKFSKSSAFADYEIFYPNGTFEGLYFQEELLLFLERGGRLLEIKYGLFFTNEYAPIFKEFAETLIKNREISENHKIVWKSILVSFYGRLGMQPDKTLTILMNQKEYEKKNLKLKIDRETWVGNICLARIEDQSKNSNPLYDSHVGYASIVTSKARIKLYKTFEAVKNEEGRVLYCDTDCIYAAYPKNKQVLGKKHGEIFWDPNNPLTIINDAVFASTKTYSVSRSDGTWETKILGSPRNLISFCEFKKIFYDGGKFIDQDSPNFITTYSNWGQNKIIFLSDYKKRVFDKKKQHTSPQHTSLLFKN